VIGTTFPDCGHEVDWSFVQRQIDATLCYFGDLGFEPGHTSSHELWEYDLSVHGVHRWVGHCEDLRPLAERQAGGEPMVATVEQVVHARREVVDAASGLDDQGKGADDAHLGSRYLPNRRLRVQTSVERVRVVDHPWIEQHGAGDIGAHGKLLVGLAQ
jgi:hypothetical protein